MDSKDFFSVFAATAVVTIAMISVYAALFAVPAAAVLFVLRLFGIV